MRFLKTTFIIILIFFVLTMLLIVANNTIHTNKIIEQNIKSLAYQSQDTTLTELSFEKYKEGIIETKTYILDSNTISYLFQVLTILIIGIGFYLLEKIQAKISTVDEHKLIVIQFIENIEFSTNIINTINTILTLSADFDERNVLSRNNIVKAYLIENQLDELISLFQKHSTNTLNYGHKTYCKNILDAIVLRNIENLSDKSDYYQSIFEKLNTSIDLLNSVKIDNTAANNVYKK